MDDFTEVSTADLRAEIARMGDDECACSSAPEICVDCTRYYEITAELDKRAGTVTL